MIHFFLNDPLSDEKKCNEIWHKQTYAMDIGFLSGEPEGDASLRNRRMFERTSIRPSSLGPAGSQGPQVQARGHSVLRASSLISEVPALLAQQYF